MRRNIRIRWEIEHPESLPASRAERTGAADEFVALHAIDQLLKGRDLVSYYQPIFSAGDGSVFGYEALARLTEAAPFADIQQMFHAATITGSLSALDIHCMECALRQLDPSLFVPSQWCLFLNACPETLMNPDLSFRRINSILEVFEIPFERIVLEITEENVISNYDLFRSSMETLRSRGFKIAIDDFGCGYAGLKMLSSIEPDFLKIDRHFINNIDQAIIRFNLVQAIATACHRIGIRVVAEGIERPEELAVARDLGIEFLQGFLLGRPSSKLEESKASALIERSGAEVGSPSGRTFIGDTLVAVKPARPEDPIQTAFHRFMADGELSAIPVVRGDTVVGVLNRRCFLEEQILGSRGYGYSLNSMKGVAEVMQTGFITFESSCTLQEAASKIQAKAPKLLDGNLVVVKNGRYQGMVEVRFLLEALTEENILLARDSNPLSGLPGNNVIQREITRRLAQSMNFDTLYIDIDFFKPFNDHYGFAKGDHVIIVLGEIIRHVLAQYENGFNFAGHIGGDDFIVITRPPIGLSIAKAIISGFTAHLPEFHGAEDFGAGCYWGANRRGETEQFPLLSVSIGIVSTELHKISCYSQFASIACEVKNAAKQQLGSAIARDMKNLPVAPRPGNHSAALAE